MNTITASPPKTMKAIIPSDSGGPEILKLGDYPSPNPGYGEVLIQVAAAGINRADCLQRIGAYPAPPGASDILGLEVAGTITALGQGISGIKEGKEVCALLTGGGYAEFCVAPEATLLPVPEGVSLVQAAALPEAYFTVWANLYDRAKLKDGESVLIHGGASGIGTAAIQIASALGSRVFTTAGTEEKCKACEKLGADHAINYRKDEFVQIIQDLTGGIGVNVVLDMVGGDYLSRNLEVLAPEGRLVHIAFQSGYKVKINLLPIINKHLVVTGSRLRPLGLERKAQLRAELLTTIWPLLEAGRLRPVIDSTFPLNDAAGAHSRMESGKHTGKILLEV